MLPLSHEGSCRACALGFHRYIMRRAPFLAPSFGNGELRGSGPVRVAVMLAYPLPEGPALLGGSSPSRPGRVKPQSPQSPHGCLGDSAFCALRACLPAALLARSCRRLAGGVLRCPHWLKQARRVARRAEEDQFVQNIKALMPNKQVVLEGDRSPEQEEEMQQLAREYLEEQGIDLDEMNVKVIGLQDQTMAEDPEKKYRTNKTLMMETYDRGEIQLMEMTCKELLAVKPHDAEVWRMLTLGRLRLKLWDVALEAARRWIAFEPQSLNPRCAEAFAQAGSQELEGVKEARVRFAQLYKEVTGMDSKGEGVRDVAVELQECVWRCDELLEHRKAEERKEQKEAQEPQPCNLSARPATVLTGARPPHYFLPNFANSIGPIKVVQADEEELGGGAVHPRKIVVTRDVEAGEPLFVQNALAFSAMDQAGDTVRLKTALIIAATLSPRQAKLLDILLDRSDWEDSDSDAVMAALDDPKVVREFGPWNSDAESMIDHLQVCEQLVLESQILTGKNYAGIWVLPAMARHSCAPSAVYTIWGDVMVARASRNLKAGDEVTFGFMDLWLRLDMRQEKFTNAAGGDGFWCRCPRCEGEATWPSKVAVASADLELRFEKQRSRVEGILRSLDLKLEEKRQNMQKQYDAIRDSEEQRIEYEAGLLGLADRFDNLKGMPKDEDIEELRKYFPENNEPELVEVRADLAEDLLDAIITFEKEVNESDLPEEQRHWVLANHFAQYSELLAILRLRRDVEGQRRALGGILDAVAATHPGSFEHLRLSVLLWEVSAQCEDPTLMREDLVRDLIPKELDRVREAIKIRYGRDLDDTEVSATMARIASTSIIDENWMWDITWCAGRNYAPEPARGPSGKVLPVLGSSILV
ncbi:unnamed protein product [Symbiodinium necroappetens]|uniref:SET domain-containing protein n=1 Tax=Symbiodinium necroappetens TaxID=1628268 RepID=A0A812SG90_9DINO|nr:unnamed protein product [Symbiodinium necroappetens]